MVLSVICYLSVLLAYTPAALVGSVNEEGMALLSLKQSDPGNPNAGSSLSTWNASDATPCLWHGVGCTDGKVVFLSVPENGLIGLLPPALGNLSALLHLNLRENLLYGRLPAELFTGAKGLQGLMLSGNSFSGSLPAEIGNLSQLQSLDLSQNSFEGPITSSLTQCKKLKNLYLGQNNFTGPIPVGFGAENSSTRLQHLNVSFNMLSGSIPNDMGNLSSLNGTLDLSHNLLSGPIPQSLGNLPEDVYIDLSYNNLSGLIPQSGGLNNRGPPAFIGNPNLCGSPLQTQCSSSQLAPTTPHNQISPPYPDLPIDGSSSDIPNSSKSSRGTITISLAIVIAIIVGIMVGMLVATLFFVYCFGTFRACGFGNTSNHHGDEGKPCFCLTSSSVAAKDTTSGRHQHHDLVLLDLKVRFDLDELLQASAFVLGKSRMGILYKVKINNSRPVLAVRRLGENGHPPQRFKEFQTEVEAIAKVRHPNIVAPRAYYWSPDEKLLIYDYMPNGNLASAIHGNAARTGPLSWTVCLGIVQGTAKGLAYLHEVSPKKYVHGNLKPTNILLGQHMEPLISDFGLSYLTRLESRGDQSQHSSKASSSATTPPCCSANKFEDILGSYYRAPEAAASDAAAAKATQKWDVYSFGMIMLEMISGKSPTTMTTTTQVGSPGTDLARWIQLCIDEESEPLLYILDPSLVRELDKVEEKIALEVIKIGLACAQESPQRRPTMKQVSDALHSISIPGH